MEILSENRNWVAARSFKGWIYSEEDVKEFIRQLKKELNQEISRNPPNDVLASLYWMIGQIDKLAGDKLIDAEVGEDEA